MKSPTPDELSVYLEIASSVLALIVAVYHFVQDHRRKKTTNPMTILARSAGMAILPQALILIAATFDPDLLYRVQGMRLIYMLSGLALVYVCIKSVKS